MAIPFTDQQKQYVLERLTRFPYFEEWDDGTSSEIDIRNLTSANWGDFTRKLLEHLYYATISFPQLRAKIDVKRCEKHPEDIQQQLFNLYLNGVIPHFSGDFWPQFAVIFKLIIRAIQKYYEMVDAIENEVAPPPVPVVPKQQPTRPPRKYIVNGILYVEK
jgi:hypothetical protein